MHMLSEPALPSEPPRHVNGARLEIANPHGLPLIALRPGTKAALHKQFWQRASADPAEIPPGHNAGVLAGRGLVVIDVDVKSGKDGQATLAVWQVIYGELPPTFTVRTPSGGEHRYYRDPLGRDFGQGTDQLGSGVDIRAHPHGYVVAPGSRIDAGAYEIIDGREPAQAPQWLIDELLRTAQKARSPVDQTPLVELDTEENIRLAVDWLVNEAPEAIEGDGGDDTTANKIAPKLKDFGLSADLAVEVALEHWNYTKAIPPWDPDELETKIRSGYRSAKGSPPGSAIAQRPENEFPALSEDEVARIESTRPERPEPAAQSEASTYRLIPWAELKGNPPPLEWVWDGLIPAGHVTTLFGDGGVGKSLLAQQLATVIAMPAERRELECDGLFGRRVKLSNLFERKVGALSEVFEPDEMNKLRQVHKILQDDQLVRSMRALADIATVPRAQNVKQLKGALEGALKAKFGVLKGGGFMRIINIWESALSPDSFADKLNRAITQMALDPELAAHLLTRDITSPPKWNRRLQQLLGGIESARAVGEEGEPEE